MSDERPAAGRPAIPESSISNRAAHWQELWSDPHNDGEIMGGAAARPALEGIWKSFFELSALGSDDCVLDIASGTAPIARSATSLPTAAQPRFVCLDYAPAALAAARDVLGPRVLYCVGDAQRLPFAARSFAGVVSQFGLEYAGHEAFAEAAAQLRAGGRLCAVVHAAGGVIALESAASASAAEAALKAGLIRRTRETIAASYDGGARGYVNRRKEAAFTRMLGDVRTSLVASPPSAGRNILVQYVADVERLAARRFAFAPEDALDWLRQVERKLKAYVARMQAMQAAARSRGDMEALCANLAACGLADVGFEPVQFRAGEPQGAWRLAARRPS